MEGHCQLFTAPLKHFPPQAFAWVVASCHALTPQEEATAPSTALSALITRSCRGPAVWFLGSPFHPRHSWERTKKTGPQGQDTPTQRRIQKLGEGVRKPAQKMRSGYNIIYLGKRKQLSIE